MIVLHTFPGRFGLESTSPFCMKVEVYLKLMSLPYEAVPGNPIRAPKKKLPFVEDEGRTIADSTMILDHLEAKQAHPLDEGIGDAERGRARAIQRMLEEALYFVILWTRWVDDAGWEVTKQGFDGLPAPVRWTLLPLIRRQQAAKTHAQGTGRHSRDEIHEMGKRDIDALAAILGDGPFFLGDRIRTVDVVGYAFLANVLKFELDTPIRDALKGHANLVRYIDRIAERVDQGAKR